MAASSVAPYMGRTVSADIFQAVYDRLAAIEGGAHPDLAARSILRHTAGGIQLLGIATEGARAICYDPHLHQVYAVDVSPIGVHLADRELWETNVDDPTDWAAQHAGRFAWRHPRVR